jgi:hypothetical protein
MANRKRPEAATSSLPCHVAGHTRNGIADPYVLRVSQRAWADLGEAPSAGDLAEAATRHRILKKFYETYLTPEAVDTGVPIDRLVDSKVFRIKSGDWRGAVRYMPDDGVLWLCRALSLAKHHDEHDAYVKFGTLEQNGLLLPNEEERQRARSDQLLISIILALREARVRADHDPRVWCPARCQRLDGSEVSVGRMYVEYDEADDEMLFTYRYLLLIRKPPPGLSLPKGWQQIVAEQVFPTGDPFKATNDLPGGTNIRPDELPLLQETIELRDDNDLFP